MYRVPSGWVPHHTWQSRPSRRSWWGIPWSHLHSFYVNDFLGGADTPQEALSLFHRLREVLQKGGFNLTKWRSSSSAVLQDIPPELHEVSHQALGLVWDSEGDVMSPSINNSTTYTTTNRLDSPYCAWLSIRASGRLDIVGRSSATRPGWPSCPVETWTPSSIELVFGP